MSEPRCPGTDMRNWKPEDIYDVKCPWCETEIEFWKDEPLRACPACHRHVPNPKMDVSCIKWCKHSSECPGRPPEIVADE